MTQELVQKNDNKARLEFRFFYYTENYDEVVGYYRDVLGFAIVDSWGEGVNDRGTVFRSPKGSGLIEIEFGAGGAPLNAGLYIEVDDVDEWKTVVKAKGLSVARDIENTSYGHRSFWLVDPGGLRIGFFSKIVPE